MGRVLVVEDEEGLREFLVEALSRAGHDVLAAADGVAALGLLRGGAFEVVLTDLKMPGVDGLELVRRGRLEQPDTEFIVLTAFGTVASAVEALKLGAFDYVEKPLSDPAEVRRLVANALSRRGQLQSARGWTGEAQLPPLTWGAPAMAAPVEQLAKVAPTHATVLLLGESGTGKELAARSVHARSPRATRPFMAVNCAALAEQLLESELFGHEKGAFTGAHALRQGRLELASGGTFLLDEVGELQPSLQAKLLRVLEERTFERVGSAKPLTAEVRWIAATHRDLQAMVRAGAFREDLYHRLAVFPVRLPPLRERPEDLLPMAELLLQQLSAGSGRPPATLTAAARTKLLAGAWPGNARELRNALERALILQAGPELGPELFEIQPLSNSSVSAPGDTRLESLERQAIVAALAASGGNRRVAAERLGIGLRTLYEKLKRYQVG